MQYTHILGLDISKASIDAVLSNNKANAIMLHYKFTNNLKGYETLLNWLKKQEVQIEQILVCLENTGIYHRLLVAFLQSKEMFVWVENALEIKRSGGIQRGKNDKIDAQRICLYAFRNQDKARPYSNMDKSLQSIADLTTTRERLVEARIALLGPIKELKEVGLEQEATMIQESCKQSISALDKEIKLIELKLESIIKEQEQLSRTYQIISSVCGIGFVTALYLLIYTHNFKRFGNAKQLSSYCGIAPFEYSSGSSVRGRQKVHPMSNKILKKALHMCAISSLRHNKEIKHYYIRKVEQGKHKMSVINAIRNKLIQRVYACVRDGRLYEDRQTA